MRNIHDELPTKHDDPLVGVLHRLIKIAVKILAVLMVDVIFWGVVDVAFLLYKKLLTPPYFMLSISDLFVLFGAFLVVLIAIEIFQNITLYLSTNVIPVKLVIATALMAIARKVIVFDYDKLEPMYIIATGIVIFSLGITYWLLNRDDAAITEEKIDKDDA